MHDSVPVLDHGYVRLLDVLGDDLTPVNAARVSFEKRSVRQADGSLRPEDVRLLSYLLEHGHTSPFRHAVLQFEVYAPLMVIRQWGKYRVGSVWAFEDSDDPLETWNESSRRYVTEKPVFYVPSGWRSAPPNKKQGSGPNLDRKQSQFWQRSLRSALQFGLQQYERALREGLAPEQARLLLPAYALYIRAWWTVSLQGVLHFLGQRLAPDAQYEIRAYAEAVLRLTREAFPVVTKLWLERGTAPVDITQPGPVPVTEPSPVPEPDPETRQGPKGPGRVR